MKRYESMKSMKTNNMKMEIVQKSILYILCATAVL